MSTLIANTSGVLRSGMEYPTLATLYTMMQGAVPVVSKYTGVAEILDEKLSIIFDPFDSEIEDILEQYESKHLDSKRNKIIKYALKFDYRWYAQNIIKIYEKVRGG